ncbi:ogr/Delta-like zinc finger family protein [Achromobacter xylosoxidans]|uniref:ogr/Delta-like zinc finger family protein n=1 Tax=Alcaligenes xylosoxydans xylosoxydans TaxID=85698 RepID=UPI00292D8E03|nr:ogr/Delta-like zinc finger family protein [Achromobacter xylosoxidans]WOB74094.1 ogr/Delta-like zinc finger family protein [Achromobacter xylosoxidans]
MTMLTTPCAVCGTKAHIVGTRKTNATARKLTWQCSGKACSHRRIAMLTAVRINAPHTMSVDLAEAPAQPLGSGTPSRASQRRKRRLLAKNKGKMPGPAR